MEAHTLRLGFNIVGADIAVSVRRLRASDFRSLSVAVGGMNTFLSSRAHYLETEMLHVSKFNPGGKISFSLFFFFFFLSRASSVPSALHLYPCREQV